MNKGKFLSVLMSLTMLGSAVNIPVSAAEYTDNQTPAAAVQETVEAGDTALAVDEALEEAVEPAEKTEAAAEEGIESVIEETPQEGTYIKTDGDVKLLADSLTYENLQYIVDGNTVTIVGCDDGVESLEIPATIDDKAVTMIDSYAFSGHSDLKTLVLPEGVTYLGSYFLTGTSVEKLTIPSTVTEAGSYYNGALAGSAVIELTFAQGMKKIPDYICRSDSQVSLLETVTLPDGVETIGDYAFANAKSLISCGFPESLVTIGNGAFENCLSLEGDINIPASVKTIGSNAFDGCQSITSVKTNLNTSTEWVGTDRVPFSATIGSSAFRNCTAMNSFELAASMKRVEDYAFQGCSNLKTLVLPEGVTYLGSYFLTGTSVEKLTIPSTVTEAGNYYNGALAGSAVTELTFAPGTKTIPYGICSSESQVSLLETVTLPDGVETIEDYAFRNCVSLESLRIPNSLTYLSPTALYGAKIKDLRIASEDSQAALTLIDLELPYTADETGIKDANDRMLDRNKTNYYATSSSVSSAGQIHLTAKYAFKTLATGSVSNLRCTIKIPSTASITVDTLKVNGQLIDYDEDNGQITFPLSDISGTINFCVSPEDSNYLMSYVKITYRYRGTDRTETVGIVNMADDVLTLFVPAESASSQIVASGITTPNQEVSIYIDGSLERTVTASATGNYSASLTLPSPTEGKSYKIEAMVTGDDGKTTTATDFVTYKINAATLTRFDMYYRGNQYDLLNMTSKSPVISWASGSSFTFVIDFDDCRKVEVVRVVSKKGTEERVLDAVYDESEDRYIASGFTGYVPGTIYVEYAEEEGNPFAGASTHIISADNEGDSSGHQVFYVDQGDESANFYYLTEYEENAAFDYTVRDYTQGTYEGKTCYMTVEPFKYEKDGGCFYAQEIYVVEDDGSYTLIRNGIGLYGDEITGTAATQGTVSDLGDTLEKLENLYDVLTDTAKQSNDSAVYTALYDFIDSAKRTTTDPKVQSELDLMKSDLDVYKFMYDSTSLFDKANEVAQKSIEVADDPDYLLPEKMAKEMDKCFNAMKDLSKSTTNNLLKKFMNKLTKWGFGGSLYEKISKDLENQYKQSNAKFRGKYSIDPSGYVYEGVESNRIQGVTATIYYKETMDSNAVVWDADEYDQFNPITTDQDGCYAWDVPEGFWQVKYEKAGYKTAYSDWLPVPPPQVDVNVGLISEAAPEIKLINAYAEAVEVVFSQYVDVATVNNENFRFEVDGNVIPGEWVPVDAEKSPSDSSIDLADTFKFIPQNEFSSNVTYSVNNVQNYAGRAIEGISDTLNVKLNIKSVQVASQITVPYGTSKTITISAVPGAAAAGKQITITSSDTFLLSADQYAVFDENGNASFSVTSLLPGDAKVKYSIEETTYSGEITVVSSMEEKTTYSVTVTNGIGSGDYAVGDSVTITANPPENGKKFLEWSGVDNLEFTNGDKTTTSATFTMPAEDVNVTAVYEDTSTSIAVKIENGSLSYNINIPQGTPADLIIARYDGTGRLIDAKTIKNVTSEGNTPVEDADIYRVFLWQHDTMVPLCQMWESRKVNK